MLTDRDIIVKVLGKGRDPQQTKAVELAQGEAVTIGADDDADEIFATMARHKVRRLPVIDGHRLVAMVAPADVSAVRGPVGRLSRVARAAVRE
ncbi:CBS domain-containing protein [Streptomyces lydicus]|uniref:CBS domain-containing protein n=1 Tax=Streptomyces lydicus TaxID=47763 RepID=UPI003F4CC234